MFQEERISRTKTLRAGARLGGFMKDQGARAVGAHRMGELSGR